MAVATSDYCTHEQDTAGANINQTTKEVLHSSAAAYWMFMQFVRVKDKYFERKGMKYIEVTVNINYLLTQKSGSQLHQKSVWIDFIHFRNQAY